MKKALISFVLIIFSVSAFQIAAPFQARADSEQTNSSITERDSSEDHIIVIDEDYSSEENVDAAHIEEDMGSDHSDHSAVHHFGLVFAMFALVLVAGKLGNIVEKYGQPAVIGELLAGIALSALGYFGWDFISQVATNEIISFLAQFGALLLLFSIGLESQIKDMKKVGASALVIAIIGVVVPFVVGSFVLGPIFFSDASSNARLFLGASLVATSVGITASVFRSLKLTRSKAAQTVLGAAVIDDVLGLIVLAVISALVSGGELSASLVLVLALKSFGFLVGSLYIGTLVARPLSKMFSAINTGIGMKVTLAISFALVFGYLAEIFGLEPIIGAFAAGLLLDSVHFESFSDPEIIEDIKYLEADDKNGANVAQLIKKHRHAHVEDLINSIGLIFIPVFFVYTGLQIDFGSLLQPKLYLIAGIISVVAVAAKFVSGIGMKGSMTEKMLVGVSMVPRGEVGLIFAATGSALGVLSDELFSTIILVVIITTFVSPALIKKLGLKLKEEQKIARANKAS